MLTQLVYTSRPRFDLSRPEGRKVLDDIATAARKHNAESGISGALLAGQDWLSQVLEGDGAALAPVLKRILADQRHENVQIVDMRMIPARRLGGVPLKIDTETAKDIPNSLIGDMSAEDLIRLASIGQR